jgi:hypothetical protein
MLSKIPHRDASPTSKGTDLLLILSHAPSTDMGFRSKNREEEGYLQNLPSTA